MKMRTKYFFAALIIGEQFMHAAFPTSRRIAERERRKLIKHGPYKASALYCVRIDKNGEIVIEAVES